MQEKPEIIEIRDCVCIAHMHADPALLIKSPLQSHRAAFAMPCFISGCFSSLLRVLLR